MGSFHFSGFSSRLFLGDCWSIAGGHLYGEERVGGGEGGSEDDSEGAKAESVMKGMRG